MEKMNNKYDIIVAGGGFAGVCAAISASRMGKRVCLIEKHNCLGGAASMSLVLPFMYYWTHTETGEKVNLSRGVFEEIVNELKTLGGTLPNWQECFNEEILKIVLNRMVIESGATLLFQCHVTEVFCQEGKIEKIKINHVGGSDFLYADYFIDATGDGNLCALGGFEFMLGRESDGLCQPMTLSFRLANVDTDAFNREHNRINEIYRKYKQQGKITNPRENILSFNTTHRGIVHFNTTRVVKLNPCDIEDLTKAEITAREQVYEIFCFLKENAQSCKNATLLSTGMQIGVRESRRVLGEHILTGEEIISCAKFYDSIATCNYDIDIHNPKGEGTCHHYFKDGEYYTIPYRSIVPKGSKNVLVAGRCISATHEAQASFRIMPTCAAIGQGAGVAAAILHENFLTPMEIDISQLKNVLKEQNAKIE